jgi:tetratricopeptide (TPR) repeat protein
MAEDLITKLTRIRDLKVIARTSSFRYKNADKSIEDIAKELGVHTVLEGSIQKEDDRIRINAQLIQAKDAVHLWAHTYDERIESVLDVQERVTSAIAEALQLSLEREDGEYQTQQPADFGAYDYYLRGMHFINTKYVFSLDKRDYEIGLRMFQKALDRDSTYALAYAGRSWAHYHFFVNTGDIKGLQLWKEDVIRAYQLYPTDPFIMASLGLLSLHEDQHEDAARFFKAAIKENANHAQIQQTIGYGFGRIGLFQKAIQYLRKSMELDPYYIWSRTQLGWCLENLGRFEEAEKYYQQNLEIDPIDRRHVLFYANNCIKMRQFGKAKNLLEKAEKSNVLHENIRMANISLYRAYLLIMRNKNVNVQELSVHPDDKIYAMLKMNDNALEFITKKISGRMRSNYWDLMNTPYYDNLRDDPRFEVILKNEKMKHNHLLKVYKEL